MVFFNNVNTNHGRTCYVWWWSWFALVLWLTSLLQLSNDGYLQFVTLSVKLCVLFICICLPVYNIITSSVYTFSYIVNNILHVFDCTSFMFIPNTWQGDMGSINCHCYCHCHCHCYCHCYCHYHCHCRCHCHLSTAITLPLPMCKLPKVPVRNVNLSQYRPMRIRIQQFVFLEDTYT